MIDQKQHRISGIDDRSLPVEIGDVAYCVHDEVLLHRLKHPIRDSRLDNVGRHIESRNATASIEPGPAAGSRG